MSFKHFAQVTQWLSVAKNAGCVELFVFVCCICILGKQCALLIKVIQNIILRESLVYSESITFHKQCLLVDLT